MRLALLSSVSFIFIGLMPLAAHAGFEFVPSAPAVVAPAAKAAETAAMPSVENAPVTSESIDQAPFIEPTPTMRSADMAADEPVANKAIVEAPAETLVAPIADPAPIASEPMELGRKAIPLTPVVKSSDALILDDAMPVSASVSEPLPTPLAAPVPAPVQKITPHPTETMRVTNTADVLWDNKAAAVHSDDLTSILPPAMPAAEPVAVDSFAPPVSSAPVIAASDIEEGVPVQGFGRQVPLALALQQIVPPNYRYSFDTGVDPGQRVSWTGGKSWKAIIMDLARNNGLNVDIVTNVVAFHRRTPMDIVSSSTMIDTSQDTVQGMPLRPAAEAAALPSPISENNDMMAADTKPMSILEPVAEKNISEIKQEKAIKTANAKTKKQAKFDTMLDGNEPSDGVVREKEILTQDEEPVVAEMPAPAPLPTPQPREEIAAISTDDIKPMNIVPASGQPNDVKALPPILDETKPVDVAIDTPPVRDEWMKPLPTHEIANAPEMSSTASFVPADMTTSREWEGYKNQTLRETLTSWSQRAGVSVVWSSEYDYPLQTDVRIAASYSDAVRTLLAGFSKAQPRPIGRLFKNDKVGAQPVLVVETQRLTN